MPDSFDYSVVNSENAQLLRAIIDDAPEYTKETGSRNAEILKSIINDTEYTDAPQSEIEELLLELKEKIAGGGGDITVESLNATENGTYQEEGKAYSPVVVNVPTPENSYQLKSIENTPCDIATFNASALPMPSLTVGITAVQSGSGDPSPQNQRPIIGVSAVNAYNYKAYQIISPTSIAPITTAGLTLSYEGKGKFRVKGKSTGADGVTFVVNYSAFTIYDGTDSYISLNNTIAGGVTAIFRNRSAQVDSWSFSVLNRTSSYVGMRGKTTDNLAVNVGASLYNTDVDFTFKIELYSNSKTTYTTALKDANDQPLVCYGGQFENVNGVQTLTVTHANIASYNGETINEPWISSMDVYSEGATPTTGAQVVYPLTTPTEIPQQSQAISTQDGVNNLWADTGDVVSGEYMEAL